MQFPEEYIKKGKFKLHSGAFSDVFYDVNSLITDKKYFSEIINNIPLANHYVGIATGGAIIAMAASIKNSALFSMIKDAELKGKMPEDNWILIDDVATTEASLRETLKLTNSQPKEIFVAVDRRKTQDKKLKLKAMFEV